MLKKYDHIGKYTQADKYNYDWVYHVHSAINYTSEQIEDMIKKIPPKRTDLYDELTDRLYPQPHTSRDCKNRLEYSYYTNNAERKRRNKMRANTVSYDTISDISQL